MQEAPVPPQGGRSEGPRPAFRPGMLLAGGVPAVLAAVGLVLSLRGEAGSAYWLLLPAGPVLLGCLCIPRFRRAFAAWLRRLWASLEDYPVRTTRAPWLATFVFVMAPAVVLMLGREFAVVSGDSAPVMPTAARLVTAGDWDLSEYADAYQKRGLFTADDAMPYCLVRRGGTVYSAYPSGMVAFALPTAAAARLCGADLHSPDVLQRLEHWTAAWVAAGCLGLFFLLALHLAGPRPAWTACLLLAAGSVVYSTVGQALWQHGGVLFGGLLALLVEFRRGKRPTLAGAAVQGAALALMLACRLTAALFVVPFGLWLLLRSPRQALAAAGFAAAAFLPWAWLYRSLYGSPFGPSMVSQSGAENWSPAGAPAGAAGVLFSPGRGVIVYQPWLLIGLLGLVRLPAAAGRRIPLPRGWAVCLGCFLLLHLAVISAWRCWWGGACWGSRLATEPVVFAALFCVRPLAALAATRFGRGAVWAAVAIGCLLHFPAVFLKASDWNGAVDVCRRPQALWSWSDPPFAYGYFHRRPR